MKAKLDAGSFCRRSFRRQTFRRRVFRLRVFPMTDYSTMSFSDDEFFPTTVNFITWEVIGSIPAVLPKNLFFGQFFSKWIAEVFGKLAKTAAIYFCPITTFITTFITQHRQRGSNAVGKTVEFCPLSEIKPKTFKF